MRDKNSDVRGSGDGVCLMDGIVMTHPSAKEAGRSGATRFTPPQCSGTAAGVRDGASARAEPQGALTACKAPATHRDAGAKERPGRQAEGNEVKSLPSASAAAACRHHPRRRPEGRRPT